MASVAVYTSRLFDEHGHSLTIAVLPQPVWSNSGPLTLEDWAHEIEVEIRLQVPRPAASFLPHVIAALTSAGEDADRAIAALQGFLDTPPAKGLDVPQAILTFAEECSFMPLVAVEQSALKTAEMVAIVTASGSIAIATAGVAPLAIGVAAGSVFVLSTTVVFARHVADRLEIFLRRRWA
jgi:hypothetical protein